MTGKWGRRVLALVLAACIVTPAGAGASAARSSGFTDVNRSHWAYDEIMDVVDRELFLGTGPDTFSPEVEMTRAMFVTVLARLAEVRLNDEQQSGFDDVKQGQWYTGAVVWAAKNGVVKGVSATSFAPERVITREEMATMIVRYASYRDIPLPREYAAVQFSDYKDISDFAADAVQDCQRAGLLNGVGNGRFDPKGKATRSQVAALISRLADLNGAVEEGVYTVHFDSNGGSSVPDQRVERGEKATKPENSHRSDYDFAGWFLDQKFKQRYDFDSPVYSDITLYARWQEESEYLEINYVDPAPAGRTEVENALRSTAYNGIHLTYPSMSFRGNLITLTGTYTPENSFTGFTDRAYGSGGYVVPIKLTAPDVYSGGDVVLTITNDVVNVSRTIRQSELSGNYYFYLLKYIPTPENRAGWDPTVTVNWSGYPVSYRFDVSGMASVVSPDDAGAGGAEQRVSIPPESPYNGLQDRLTYVDTAVTKHASGNQYTLALSGRFAAGGNFPGFADQTKYGNGFVVPLRFTAPGTGASATVKTTRTVEPQAETAVSLQGSEPKQYFDYFLYIPASATADFRPVITVTWNYTPTSRSAWPTTVSCSYTVDVSAMTTVRSVGKPEITTLEQMRAAVQAGTGNERFAGVEQFTANVSRSEPATAGGITSFSVSGTYKRLLEDDEVPGFGTAGTDLGVHDLILPLSLPVPDGLSLDLLSSGENALSYTSYTVGQAAPAPQVQTKAAVSGGRAYLWLRVRGEDIAAIRTAGGIRIDLTWFGGYQEHYVVSLGELTELANNRSLPPVAGTVESVEAATRNNGYRGLENHIATITLAYEEPIYRIRGSYEIQPVGTTVPGFGAVGDGTGGTLPRDFCIVPLSFQTPLGLDLDNTAPNQTVVNYAVYRKGAGESAYSTAPYQSGSFTKADGPYHFFYRLDDPTHAAGTGLKFVLTWQNGFVETVEFQFGDLARTGTHNAEGDRFVLTQQEKDDIKNSAGGFRGIPITNIEVLAKTQNGKTALKLTSLDQAFTGSQLQPYYGAGYTDGYVAALKFTSPLPGAVQVSQTVTHGFSAAEATTPKTTQLEADGIHILLMYIPKTAPRADYGPQIELTWSNGAGANVVESYQLDLSGMDVTLPSA